MNKYYTIIILLIISSVKIFSQNYFITGRVFDSETKKPASLANVIILTRLVDTPLDDPQNTFVKGEASDKDGRFTIKSLSRGKYVLKISYMGYKTYNKPFEINNSSIDEGEIFLIRDSLETEEVKVIEKIPPVLVKKDTIEFNSNAFKTNKDADAEQLISKMPGITVQDGKVQAQGEDVQKVLVDGKQFFGDDPRAVLRNIPAEIIDRIQVFDQQSEQAQFTGFDDGNTSKTVNLVTRMGFREGIFGRLSGGYGDEERYKAGGNVNFFNNDQRITLLSQFNNVNEQNFSMEDILGVMGGTGGMMGMRGRSMGGAQLFGAMSGPMRPMGNFRGGPMSDFFVNTLNGLSSTKAFGVNYSNTFGKKTTTVSQPPNPGFRFPMRDLDEPETKNESMLEMNGSYFFNNTNSDANTFTSREYFLTQNAGQNYNEENISASKNTNHRFNLRLDYTIDSTNSILFTPRFSYQKNDGNSFVNGETNEGINALNSTTYLYNTDLSALNSSAELLYRHRFAEKGRTISVSINPSYYKNDGETNLFSESIYYDRSTFPQ
ncbi:MAG TPA: TonB-dependent receptor, partial [Ignavibacteriaceae bacterium]|nr:TonB-dependent receptor [Ignavibacteriaceae bacterium]